MWEPRQMLVALFVLALGVAAAATCAAAAAAADYSERLMLDDTPVTGCSGFWDLEFDPWAFDRYTDYFDESSTFTLYGAGSFQGPASIQEYVKFASPESPFVESMLVLPGSAGYLKVRSIAA